MFFSYKTSRLAMRPIQPLIQRVPDTLTVGTKRPGGKDDHSLPSNSRAVLYVYFKASTCSLSVVLKYWGNLNFALQGSSGSL